MPPPQAFLPHMQEGAGAKLGQDGAAAGAAGTLPGTGPEALQGREGPNKRQKLASAPFMRDGEVRGPPPRPYLVTGGPM